MGSSYDTVAFLSDFGHADEFVGVVHSVICSIAPQARVIDLVHDLPPHDVRAGSLALARSVQYLPPGVVLAVVDPGVGTRRRAIAVEVGAQGQGVLVGPDNGLLAPAVSIVGGATRAFELTNTSYQLPAPGTTFAGRDVFAPAAAHLCNGVSLAELGKEIDSGTLVPGLVPVPRVEDGALVTEVLWVDRFGNCQLNVGPEDIAAYVSDDRVRLRLRDGTPQIARRAEAYGELAPGQAGLVIDSYGLVSLAIDGGSASEKLGLAPGAPVTFDMPA